ncbi:MAG: Gfo/Idh/MocA family protein, partial [Armatimonadota bacterium]
MKPVRMGFVGAGYMGQVAHIANYARLERAEMLALAEPREALRRRVAERYHIQRTYPDHRELAADPDVEAVAAIMHESLVPPVVRDLLEAGKHVITEKPMGVASDECAELAALAEEQDLVYQVGYMKRHDTGISLARGIIDEAMSSGRYGELGMVRVWNFGGEWQYGIEGPITTDEEPPQGLSPRRPLPEWIPEELQPLYRRVLNVDSHVTNLVRLFIEQDYEFEHVGYRGMDRPFVMQGWSEGRVNCVFEIGQLPAPRWYEGLQLFFERAVVRIEPPPPLRRQAATTLRVPKT